MLLANGADVKTVQNRLGHSSASLTLDLYAHATLADAEDVALGLVLLGPGVRYPPHHHPAEEFYLPAGAIRPREQDCELPAYAALPELCDKISHASHNCACKLRRRLRLSSSPIIPAAPIPVNARQRALS